MSAAKETFRKIKEQSNLAGSHKTLELQRSFFEGEEWEDYPMMASLECAWREYAQSQEIIPELEDTRDRGRRDAIESYVKNLEWGILPPPETLLLLHNALERYLQANGDLSLDEAFFGEPHKKNSSYAMAWGSKHEQMMAVSTHIALSKISLKKMTRLEAVESMLSDFYQDFDTDPESLLRAWRRWRKASNKWTG